MEFNIISLEQIKIYLPKYLSPESERQLFEEIAQFPDNIDRRFYTTRFWHEDTILQGDGIKDLLVVNLPDTKIAPAPSVIMSNTCDISLDNVRMFPNAICYAPIFNMRKYRDSLLQRRVKSEESIEQHLDTIRKQRITQIFYLPKGSKLEDESLVFLDRINNCQNEAVSRRELSEKRLFTLSNYGAWLFLLKLSIHFTRFMDRVDRSEESHTMPLETA